MAEVKGTVINAWKEFLKQRYGEEKLATAMKSLDGVDRASLESPILNSTWYPIEMQDKMSRLTRALAGPADKNMAADLGRYMADYVYSQVYRMLLKTSAKKGIDWFDDVVYRGLRTYVVEPKGPAATMVRYQYPETKPTSGQCRTLQAFITRKLELAGYKNVRCVHQKCLARGHDSCEFLMEWEATSQES